MKKRLAIFMHGGVGGGFHSQGQPNIAVLVNELAKEYNVIVYSQFCANEGFSPSFRFVSAPKFLKVSTLRWLWLIAIFLLNHIEYKQHLLYAFWAYPAGFWCNLVGKICRVPSIVHLQGGEVVGLPTIQYGVLLKPRSKRLVRWTLQNAAAVIALTQYQKKFAEVLVSRPYHVIPFGVDLNQFAFEKKQFHRPLRFLHVGSFIPVKDQSTLLNCFAQISGQIPAVLQLVGEGYLESALKAECKSLNIDSLVTFSGFHPHIDIQKFYEWADVLIHTSLYEGQCLAVTEAAASGVLIAGTNVGLISDLGSACCVVAETGEADELARAIVAVVQKPEERSTNIENARKWSEANSFENSYQQIRQIIDYFFDKF
jgi:glycosyltransferase involved in cell wall biosynthesis